MIYESIVRLIALLVGCLYPAFMSNKVLSAKKPSDVNMRVWVSYWIVYAVFLLFDYFTQGFVALVPFLNEFKVLFLCWLLPTLGGGSKIIYEQFLCSFLKSNEKSIDQALINASQRGGDIIGQVRSVIFGQVMNAINCLGISRHNKHKLRITPSIEVIINEVLAKRELRGQIQANVEHGPQEDIAGEMKTIVLAKENVDRPKPKLPPKPAARQRQLPVNENIDIILD
ncbi:receptor expression-enhancing protein 1 [Drosophila obscura]|uniref:receptor expression-enhancing protein 1 n=1 Tax=Drosophila obscura TaxID=7282 RepID=UPI001BB13D63|nr:receptor expression-enhancing protein 1 [Drosophila obscura]